ncbi:TrkH family potassium uptake protein [Haloimpatiens sp. FM7315]|uniref:TrkH family potassium uptake protein n=1 Tax=Haloimpatiens sp. FM7315 TaxID=3298609 RepID=UPI0035A2E370
MENIKNKNLKIIGYYSGYIVNATAILMLIPVITSILFREWSVVIDFIISAAMSLSMGLIFILYGREIKKCSDIEWKHGLVIAAFSWIVLTILCAVPYVLSGYCNSLIDGCFDVMSGFTTTGLVLIQDLDHAPMGLNMWRHIITFLGGQGMVVFAISFMIKKTVGAYKIYVGEGKDIELVPNIKGTAKIIWFISFIYLIIGTIALWINGIVIGLKPVSSFFHALFIYMSAWSTGGFSPMSQGMGYYHSFSYENIAIIFFIIGSLNFGLHYKIWLGDRKEIFKNIETKSFFISVTTISFFCILYLVNKSVYNDAASIFRRVVFNVLSAHTTTGFANVYAKQFTVQWGEFGIICMTIAMLIGGSACSTAGGFKGLRVGIVLKGIIAYVKKLMISERSVKIFKFHYMKEQVLTDSVVKSSCLIILCYIALFVIGTCLGSFYGYPLAESAFEAASVTGNVGLTIGVTTLAMPYPIKVYYIVAMYLGRLEFISVFALIGFVIEGVKKLCLKK